MNMKRMRGRTHRNSGGGGGGGSTPRQYSGNIPLNRNHVFDSSGPDLRIRGTAQQLFEKYLQLGRDATGSGDRVMAESYFQYAEHYFRIVSAINQAAQQNPQHQHGQSQSGQGQSGQGQSGQAQSGQAQNGQGQNGHNGSNPNGQNHQAPQQNAQRRHERDGYEGDEQPHGSAESSGPQAGYGDQPTLDGPISSEG